MRLIVTRVQPQAQQWAQALCDQGHEAKALPLIETRGLTNTAAITQAWQSLAKYRALMFVSAHAVAHFYKKNEALALINRAQIAIKIRYWGTGPGTRAALLAHGLDASLIDTPPMEAGQFDSETLWQGVWQQVQPGQRVLIVRGDTPDSDEPSPQGVGRNWLAQRLQAAGAEVDYVVAYQRGAPCWNAEQLALARCAATDRSVWVFSSAEALGNLRTLLPVQDWGQARAVVTHSRIAEAARQLGFTQVLLASPSVQSVLASIESMA